MKIKRKEALKEWIKNQPKIAPEQLNPRNKANYTDASHLESAIGSIYNAHKLRLLDKQQLNVLYTQANYYEVDKRGFEDSIKWCHKATGVVKKEKEHKPASTTTTISKKPRGIELPRKFRYGFFSIPTNKEKEVITWEKTHIILAYEGRFPPSSEHEISHRCHNPDCIKSDHLLWELHSDNVEREKCRYTRKITCPNCSYEWNECDHQPSCI